MCKCCNLFSPSQSELLSHVSEKHTEEGVNVDDIIIPLRPLSTPEPTNPSKTGDELSVMKRKRGRPKGSTKKPSAEEELAENLVRPGEDSLLALADGGGLAASSLECAKCCRKFSNARQLRKHVCIIVLNLGEDEGEAGNESDLELEKKFKEEDREKAPRRPRTQRTEKAQRTSSSGKEARQAAGTKKPIISVVLTAHEAIPGATKIVPVEAGPPEIGATNPEATSADMATRRGYQEYAIQQTPYEQPMKSSRLGPTQLKIFTCEYCNKVFKFKHSLQAHLRIHTNEKPYKCPQCSYASAIKANLNVHLRKHTGEKFSCDYCAFTCLSKGHLKVHIERVHKKIKQHCRFCKKKYSDVKNLIKHIRDVHDPQDKKVQEALDELCLMTREGKRQLLYDCHICERKFKNELDRDRHMLVHGDKWPFACELCGHGATKYQALELHVRKHPFVYVCAVCLRTFVSTIRLRAHIGEAHSAAPEAAVFASSINQSFCLLEPGGDIQQEALGGQLQLAEEEFVFQGKRRMDTGLCARIRKVYGDLECEYCGCGRVLDEWREVMKVAAALCREAPNRTFQSQCMSGLWVSWRAGSTGSRRSGSGLGVPGVDKRSYSCPVCEKSFSEDRLIKSHIKTNHPEVSMSTISAVLGRRVQLKGLIGKRAMKCPYCDFYFMQNGSDLQRHIWAHEGVKPFKCSLCEYATRSKSNLKAHMNRHSTEKTHLCDMCGKKFKSKGTLKSHKLLHTADGKQFKCTVCDYTAAQRPQLLRHMEQHASFKPFRCAHCHYSCNISGSLKRHYNRKHPNEEYANVGGGELAADALVQQGGLKCPVCSFVYGTKWEFNRHLKNKHGLKLVENEGEPKWERVISYSESSRDRLDPTAVNILQQIIELGTETHDATAVASVVAMAPGTVTVVKQVTDEEPSSNHTVMIQETLQQASVELAEQHHLVVSSDEVEGIETVTVYTQGGEASEFIVYVQEAMQPVEEPAVGQAAQEL
ncbi:Zinc finger protein ZFAT [Pteropus alecto]|uniref:Zinc finger protein ZFAT n=1 Tax=Pteropus alecto TaxID=9402 RepID=L5KM56_PTEAL|nr:Zinc finger protein ZFAT [Pteropus alecto]